MEIERMKKEIERIKKEIVGNGLFKWKEVEVEKSETTTADKNLQ